MGEKMTLEKAAEFMRLVDNGQISGRISEWVGLREACGVIHRHLTQPAQAVDVEMRRACDVALLFCETGAMRTGWSPDRIRSAFEKLRVLGNANGKEG